MLLHDLDIVLESPRGIARQHISSVCLWRVCRYPPVFIFHTLLPEHEHEISFEPSQMIVIESA